MCCCILKMICARNNNNNWARRRRVKRVGAEVAVAAGLPVSYNINTVDIEMSIDPF